MEPYDAFDAIDPFAAAIRAFDCLKGALAGPDSAALSHHELEDLIEVQGRELLRLLFQSHLDLRERHEREQVRQPAQGGVRGADGQVRPHREAGHSRTLACVFGTVTVTRCAWRGKGQTSVHPQDAALSLPAGLHSHGLRRLAVLEAVRGSYDQAKEAIDRRCGKVLGKRQAEQLVVAAAVDIDLFYRHKMVLPATVATTLVLQVDGKGIAMRPEALRPATLKAHLNSKRVMRTRLAPGEKPHRKRMATLACVFDADPAPRRPHDIIAPPNGRSGARPPRPGPKARAKWLTGSVIHLPEHTIAAAFDQAEARDRGHARNWVVLVDGARHQLDLIQAEAVRRGITVHVLLDIVHVSEYIWAASHSFHKPGTPEVEAWVAGHLTTILHGQAARAAHEMTIQADKRVLGRAKREAVDACIRYLTGHRDQLDYSTALAKGWPIATGPIEGACRYLIGDRLEITGARWGLTGAEAVLKLRALNDNGDFEEYWHYHLAREHERLYHAAGQDEYTLTA
ncbi:ISKra4 family transposase [Streptomyces fulvoviolaceus]|uniref:ISKra4 family transposase n=1 Tax=Streptomyces fulvoviolaceus TaxID=285535 RepID=UPI0021BEF18B|nr:ISKra4 family transposase [Streptomyces fulvoviolaceus]MCT9084810.1 ISKra4 family transposase [Streptomyces fulvoviolaceus]